jgi:hypothetical protein
MPTAHRKKGPENPFLFTIKSHQTTVNKVIGNFCNEPTASPHPQNRHLLAHLNVCLNERRRLAFPLCDSERSEESRIFFVEPQSHTGGYHPPVIPRPAPKPF